MVCVTVQLAELIESVLALAFILIAWKAGTLEVKKSRKVGALKIKKSRKSRQKRKK